VVAAALLGAAVFVATRYEPSQDWRSSAAELERLGRDALSALTARPASPPGDATVTPPSAAPAPREDARVEPEAVATAPSAPPSEPAAGAANARAGVTPSAPPAREARSQDEPAAVVEPLRASEPSSAPAQSPAAAAPTEAAPAAASRATPTVSLDVSEIAARENHTAVVLEVVRGGDSGGAATVSWWTTPGTARAYDDYASLGPSTLTLAPGETVGRLLIPLVDDSVREPAETFTVHVRPGPGASAGAIMAARVTVHDDD
jgi:hypothetical protein